MGAGHWAQVQGGEDQGGDDDPRQAARIRLADAGRVGLQGSTRGAAGWRVLSRAGVWAQSGRIPPRVRLGSDGQEAAGIDVSAAGMISALSARTGVGSGRRVDTRLTSQL